MPYASEKQRRYMHAKLPKIAARWDREYGSTPVAGKLRKKRTASPRSGSTGR